MKRNYLSSSALNQFLKSPNHYLAYVSKEIDPTPAMIFGSAVHCFILEPDEFESRYAISPKFDRRTKAGKEAHAEFEAQAEGKIVLNQLDLNQLEILRNRILESDEARRMIEKATAFEIEKEIIIETAEGSIPFRGIADGIGNGYIFDLKTTQDSSPDKFSRSAYSFGYHLQAAAYRKMFGVDDFFWLAIEKDPPFNVMIYRQAQRAKDLSDEHLIKSIEAFIRWDGKPSSYEPGIMNLDLPGWI